MSAQANKALVRRFVEEVNARENLVAAEHFLAPHYVDHSAPGGFPPGPEGWRQLRATFFSAFPNLRISLEDIVADGDKVAVRFTLHGTHGGEFMGMSPTGKEVEVTGIDINRIVNGKIAERWAVIDTLGLLQQLGTIPTPG